MERYRLDIAFGHRPALDGCLQCGFHQFRDPHWLDEAYAKPIAATDIGLVARTSHLAPVIGALWTAIDAEDTYVDAAGGYGLLARRLRDSGIDVRNWDPYTEDLLSGSPEPPPRALGISAVEVLEHLPDPVGWCEDLVKRYRPRFLAMTTILIDEVPPPDWWYLTPETGQHVSFYTRESLEGLAARIGFRLVWTRHHLHFFAALNEAVPWATAWARSPLAELYWRLRRRGHSLLPDDHDHALRQLAGRTPPQP